jgi:tetratricopeptide (TPR) repeat protein
LDYHAIAKLYEATGYPEIAQSILCKLLDDRYLSTDIAYDLGMIYKRQKDWDKARELFSQGADLNDKRCLHELILILENKDKNYPEALLTAQKLLLLLDYSCDPNPARIADTQKRILRLERKLQA